MIAKDISCKSLMNQSKLADYCINCYVGCEHGCKYCYAESITRRFSKHKEQWGKFVDVKLNAPDILKREIANKKKGTVFISSLTDAYQPLEKKYELTRKVLEILLEHQFSVCIQTKSSLILRDLDLIKKFKNREVGFTITSLNEKVRETFEPFSSPANEKLEALKILKENGIKTYAFFGPILPFLSDENLEEYIRKISEAKVDFMYIDKLNLKSGVWENLKNVLEKDYPELLPKWNEAIFSENDYFKNLKQKITKLCEKNNIKYNFCY